MAETPVPHRCLSKKRDRNQKQDSILGTPLWDVGISSNGLTHLYIPSLDGVTALLDAGLAGAGDAAPGTGMAMASVGIMPAWGEASTGPLGLFPILFCLGDRGL